MEAHVAGLHQLANEVYGELERRENGGRTSKDRERQGVESWVGKMFELEGEENQKMVARIEWVPGCGDGGARGRSGGRVRQWAERSGGEWAAFRL